ncbi:MAG: Ig-like domain-containing protein [Clostridia bacterium]
MKKVVIISICLIFILSVVFVGFFGMEIAHYDETVYVTLIECVNSDMLWLDDEHTEKYVVINYVGGVDSTVYQLDWKVYPEDATNRNVRFVYDEDTDIATVTQTGVVIFHKSGSITVTLKSADGTTAYATVTIYAVK